MTKAELIKEAKRLGLKVHHRWTITEIKDAVNLAKTKENQQLKPTEPEPIVIDTEDETNEQDEADSLPAAPVSIPAIPSQVERGPVAGRYQILNTITKDGEAHHSGTIYLDAKTAKTLLDQQAVIHVDDYPAYLAALESAQNEVKANHRVFKRVKCEGAGTYRAVVTITHRGNVVNPGELVELNADEVRALDEVEAIEVPGKERPRG